jgi:hypothetical protein
MNERQIIKPLPGLYKGDPAGNDNVEWTEGEWLVARLSAQLFAHYNIGIRASAEHLTEDGDVNFVSNGMLPDVALQKSREIDAILSSAQQEEPLGFNGMEIGVVCSTSY